MAKERVKEWRTLKWLFLTTASTCLGYVTILASRRFAPWQESRHYASQVKRMLARLRLRGAEERIKCI